MRRIKSYNIAPRSGEIDEHTMLADRILLDLSGGTEEDGEKLAKKILEKIKRGQELTHNLIIFGEKFYEDDENKMNKNIRAENTPFNKGLIRTIEPSACPSDIVGGNEIAIGRTGLVAVLECVWEPEFDLTQDEINGLRRHLKGNLIDQTNPSHAEAGIVVMPKVALRASLKV